MALRRVLIANRGEIAVRVIRACFDEGIESVLAVSAADRESLGAQLADRVVVIGPAAAAESYLDIDRVVSAAKVSECDGLHPGYGFLSERPELSAACAEEGIAFVGPSEEAMRRSGDKATARALARELEVPINEGSDVVASEAEAREVAERIGYPVLLKAAGGGGGRGMRRVEAGEELAGAWAQASGEAEAAFGDGRIFVERYVRHARHVEVQVLGDGEGGAIHVGHRDCTLQRRYQKLIEEAPAYGLPQALDAEIKDASRRMIGALDYAGAATCEFLVDPDPPASSRSTPGCRSSTRSRRWSPGSTSSASSCVSPAARASRSARRRSRSPGTRSRSGSTPSRRPATSPRRPAPCAAGWSPRGPRSASTPPASPAGPSRPTTTRCWRS
jgi:acetyl-CoA carboxylase biotin carboxylase subunit